MAELLDLPDELLIMILGYCSTTDHVRISRVCHKLNDITCDRKAVKVVNFHYDTSLDQNLTRVFLTYGPRTENITTIDLTSCYWLTSSFIRNVISRLRQVENVLVADTALLPQHLKHLLLTLPRITRLSWTWRSGMDTRGLKGALTRLQFLYMCVIREKHMDAKSVIMSMNNLIKWINKCVNLKELWINRVFFMMNIGAKSHPVNLNHLERIVLYSSPSWPRITTSSKLKQLWGELPNILQLDQEQVSQIESILAHGWNEIAHIIQNGAREIERISCLDSSGPDFKLLSQLNRLKALHLRLPKDEFLVFENLLPLSMNLIELRVQAADPNQESSSLFCEFASSFPKLKYLYLPTHALTCDLVNPITDQMDKSRKRVSRMKDDIPESVQTPFKKLVLSTPDVEVFEMGTRDKYNRQYIPKMPHYLQWDFASLSMIQNWNCLCSLTLAELPIKHGNFLLPILKCCKQLKKLKLVDLGPKTICVYSQDLYRALPHCHVLQDFYWDQSYVGCTKTLWMVLQQIPTLQRIVLRLPGISSFEVPHVCQTMEKCSSLFLVHVASCSTKVQNQAVKRLILERWSTVRPQINVWFGTPIDFKFEGGISCPMVHVGEMFEEVSCTTCTGIPVHGSHKRFLSFGSREWAPHI